MYKQCMLCITLDIFIIFTTTSKLSLLNYQPYSDKISHQKPDQQVTQLVSLQSHDVTTVSLTFNSTKRSLDVTLWWFVLNTSAMFWRCGVLLKLPNDMYVCVCELTRSRYIYVAFQVWIQHNIIFEWANTNYWSHLQNIFFNQHKFGSIITNHQTNNVNDQYKTCNSD